MATNIFNFDGTLLTTVADGSLDITHASIKFPGRGYQNYGEPIMENLLWVMQNFSGTTAPLYPSTGQLWYDTNSGNNILKVWTGVEWTIAGGVISSNTAPASGANPGAFWYDTVNQQLNIWNDDPTNPSWDLIGPLGSAVNTDPIDPGLPINSSIEAMRVVGVEDGANHQVWRITVGGTLLAVLSKDQAFTPQSTILTSNGFSKIYPGINFNSTITNIGLSGDNTLMKTNKSNLPSLDANWDLGSSAKRWGSIYSSRGVFSNGLAVNTTPGSYNFEVNGTSKFSGTATFAASTASTVPVKFLTSTTLANPPQTGAIEFDGNNFQFTGLLNGVPTRRTPLFAINAAAGKSIYVSAGGDDSNDGRTRNTAYKTINKALAEIIADSLDGYTVFVESGEYLEQNPMYVPPRTSIVGDNLRRVIIRPVHNQLDIFHVDVNTYFFGMTFKDHRAPAFCFSFPCSQAQAVLGGTGGNKVIQILPKFSKTGYTADFPVFVEPPPYGAGNIQATAVAKIVDSAIIDVVVTASGSGYSTAPGAVTATLSTTDGGEGAAFSVRVDTTGKVVAVDITDPGKNYGANTQITINGPGGSGATAKVVLGNGVIRSYEVTNQGSGYTRAPLVSIKAPVPPFITSSPYVQNCSSITGPFDDQGRLITVLPGEWTSSTEPGGGFSTLDPNGAGAGLRIDGELLDDSSVIRSFVADAFTQLNQGGIGHLIVNRGYAQFVSCFTTYSSIGYWARSGGFCNISNSVIDFGDIGLQAEGYYPVAYTSGPIAQNYRSTLGMVNMVSNGTGYSADFPVTFTGGLDTSGVVSTRAATGTAIVVSGSVTNIVITDPGEGYVSAPTVDLSAGVTSGTAADAEATLAPPEYIQVNTLTRKPQFGSGLLLNNEFHIINQIEETATPGNYRVIVNPPIYAANQGVTANFHEISNISSGGLALEYVGSGVTYNALPVYGGEPDVTKQVKDGESPLSPLYPGRVYYVTIDNTGNFNIGPYFAVNFVDGSIKLNANTFELTNLSRIGPFRRNGITVGTVPGPGYANEISSDPTLTHVVNAAQDDATTLPTQSAVTGYFSQINRNVVPDSNNLRNIGSASKNWANVYTSNVTVGASGVFNGNVGIGTSTPIAPLHVWNGTSGGEIGLGFKTDSRPLGRIGMASAGETFIGFNMRFIGTGWEYIDPVAYGSKASILSQGSTGTRLYRASNGSNPPTITEPFTIDWTGNVGIGSTAPVARLDVAGNVQTTGAVVINNNTTNFALDLIGNGSGGGNCVRSNGSTGAFTAYTSGTGQTSVMFTRAGAAANKKSWELLSYGDNFIIRAIADNYSSDAPAITMTRGNGTVVAGVNFPNGNVSVGASDQAYKFSVTGVSHFFGNIEAAANVVPASSTWWTGNLQVTGAIIAKDDIIGFYSSDERLKTNVEPISNALDKVVAINGVTFDWTPEVKTQGPHRDRREAGVLAQEVEKVLPEVVATKENGYKAVDYEKIVPLLIEAIKELKAKVDRLEKSN